MKLLIVEDSALMRRVLRENLADQVGLEIAFARDGEDALEKLDSFEPDVITLDINMPKMDGLTCLAHIMDRRPSPVIMLSSLTERGAVATFEALELGAVDFVAKPDGTVSQDMSSVMDELKQKIQAAGQSRTRAPRKSVVRSATPPAPSLKPRPAQRTPSQLPRRVSRSEGTDLLLIGSSTGGPGVLQAILEKIPADFPVPILIAQHMPAKFTATFSRRLNEACAIKVTEVSRVEQLLPGNVYLAAGGRDVVVRKKLNRLIAESVPVDANHVWHPSVSRLVSSAMEHISAHRLAGVMLTGMGDDGATEMACIHQNNGWTIAESSETAAVFGMPGQLIARNGASIVLPAHEIADALLRQFGRSASIGVRKCS